MTNLDRAGLVQLLDRLGAENDETVLQAARELHRKMSEAGLTWDDVLRLDADLSGAGTEAERDDAPQEEPAADDRPVETEGGLSAADRADATRLIERLLRKNLSSTMREDLADFKRALVDGSCDATDHRYVRALAKRLGA